MTINTTLVLILCMFVWRVCVGGWVVCRVCCCCSVSNPVYLLSSTAHLNISNGTTLAAEPAAIPQLSHTTYTKIYIYVYRFLCTHIYTHIKYQGEKTRAQRSKPLLCVQICLPAGDACLLYVSRSACASRASVCISKTYFAAFKMQNDQFPNVLIKHETHIFFSAYKDAITISTIELKFNLLKVFSSK